MTDNPISPTPMKRSDMDRKVQVLRDILEKSKQSPYGNDCGGALSYLSGLLQREWPEMAEVIDEMYKFGRETERKRGWI